MYRTLSFACLVAVAGGAAAFAAGSQVTLPTEWRLTPPPGLVASTKTFPESAVRTADGAHLIVVEGGAGSPGIAIFATRDLAHERDITLANVYGAPLADRSGSGFWVGTAADDSLVHIDAATGTRDRTIVLPRGFWPAAIARSPDGATLAASGDLAGAVVFVDLATSTVGAPIRVGSAASSASGEHPAGVAFAKDGKTLFVANWAASTVAVIDVAARAQRGTIVVGKHPQSLLLSRDGAKLYVTESDDDALGVIDVAARARVTDVNVAPYGGRFYGASPTALAASSDGKRLYVALAAANAIAIVALDGTPRLLGAFPSGWYPTALSLAPDDSSLDVVNGLGEGGRPNPQFKPYERATNRDTSGYVAAGMIGSVRRVAIPADAALPGATRDVLANAGPSLENAAPEPPGTVVRKGGPIAHVIYIVKENRTYDQVLGDFPAPTAIRHSPSSMRR